MNIIDTVVGWVNPRAALKREAARTGIEQLRKYDAASKGRRTEGWYSTNIGPNTLLEMQLDRLRGRSRDMERNNNYARKAIKNIATSVVGTGIIPAPIASRAAATKLKKAWKAWAGKKACDFYGQQTMSGLQRMAMMAVVRDGEVLIRRRRVAGPIPIKIQVQEADCLDTAKNIDRLEKGGYIIQGVEFDANDQRVAYWLWDRHPSEKTIVDMVSRRIPASDVAHVMFAERPGQVRGIPWMATALLGLKDFGDYEDAELVRQKIAACFTVFITDHVDSPATTEDLAVDRVEPGIIERLKPGQGVEFANPPVTQNYDNYARRVLQGSAAGIGLSYESLTGDLKNVNFSSGRMGWIDMQRNVEDWQFNMMVPQFCDVVWEWFTSAAFMAGAIPKSAVVDADWTPPRREMIDPSKEILAQVQAVRAGILPLSEVYRQNGYDPEEVFQQLAADNKRIDELGLVLDSDARKTMKAGVIQPIYQSLSQAAGGEDPEPEPAPQPPAQ